MTDPLPLSVVIHGHFYQPPRENPWTGTVPAQPSAAPHHDWNARILAECYEPVTRAPILDAEGTETRRLNTLESISFNFGPTLLTWLERNAPDTYRSIIEADRKSCERLGGHGNAMAMSFHHTILPLSDPRDRRTEIRWGLHDFRRRFGREPEGMWLPETAVDSATAAAIAAEGIRFIVLAPTQVVTAPPRGLPGTLRTPNGELAVFVYDGGLSHGVAFGDLVRDGARWAEAMAAPFPPGGPALRSLCTDGETYGHHHDFGEMGLAAAIDRLSKRHDVRLENYASFLAAHSPSHPIELVEPSAWSCAHGVERWRSDCGCRADTGSDSTQAWRGPLREALTWLAERLHEVYEREGTALLGDPWAARDAYGAVASLGNAGLHSRAVRTFLSEWVGPDAGRQTRVRAFRLLEMERDALRLFTSCAWFFDDVARVEPLQVLTYAAHALEQVREEEATIRGGFMQRLGGALANDPADGTAADLFAGILESRPARRRP